MNSCSANNIHDVSCQVCNVPKIYSDRYRCLVCVDYDLCGFCFEERRISKTHSNEHVMVHLKVPKELFNRHVRDDKEITLLGIREILIGKHHEFNCDRCLNMIVGVRFKCDTCYQYNLCFRCMELRKTSKHHQRDHPLYSPQIMKVCQKLVFSTFKKVLYWAVAQSVRWSCLIFIRNFYLVLSQTC